MTKVLTKERAKKGPLWSRYNYNCSKRVLKLQIKVFMNKLILMVILLTVSIDLKASEQKTNCSDKELNVYSWGSILDRLNEENSKIRSVEDFLCILPKKIRSSYTLSRKSRSFQESSSQNPRAILFDKDNPTKLILSFNGDPSHRGYQNIELIRSIDDSKGRIELIDLAFSKDQKPVVTIDPPKCLACHGTRISQSDRRLLFDANPLWKNFYGSGLFSVLTENSEDDEKRHFLEFQKIAKNHPRYRYLEDLDQKTLAREVDDNFIINHKEMAQKIKGDFENNSLIRANKKFSIKLAEFNHLRILHFVMQSDLYKYYKYAIYGALVCGSAEKFIPENLKPWHTNESRMSEELKGLTPENLSSQSIQNINERIKKDATLSSLSRVEKFAPTMARHFSPAWLKIWV